MSSSMSRLEAVNLCLSAAGMMPVSTIETNTTADARLILNILDAAHRDVMAEGWHWNTEYETSLESDAGTGEVAIPDTFLRFDPRDSPHLIQRGNRVYDLENKTKVINSAVSGTAIVYLEWDDTSQEVRTYIQKLTARRYYEQHVGSSESLRSLYADEQMAQRALKELDFDAGSYSIFDSPDMQAGLSRGNMYVGRAAFNGQDPFTNRTPAES